ncbi:chaperonin 60 subunit beta 1, chloroplastic [Gossypium raimondii]|uniref:Uncharacterized protein n=1 Tax=Gossypium raimondii TaxID=29730 RepID=A0A0D2RQC1_GOSRA|nr:chaperonin 60 subunit beta 1, chloroplastic [Gossypium raimondii]KJB72902.1 hypothetical protein B456_011G203800 [Gossypium raimondii]
MYSRMDVWFFFSSISNLIKRVRWHPLSQPCHQLAGVNKFADLVGVTLGPKGRNVVLESKYGSPKIVNDGVIVAKEVVRCCLEHATSVAKTFLMSYCVVVEIKKPEPVPAGNPMDNSGYGY